MNIRIKPFRQILIGIVDGLLINNNMDKKKRLGIYLLPSFFTSCGLFCGFYSIITSINSMSSEDPKFSKAAIAIIIAAFFDGIDGRIARLTKSTTQFGLQYDSLCDLASFALAPSILMYAWGLKPFGRIGWLACFLFTACGALRLARFNVQSTTVEKKHFLGLPSPIAAFCVATTILFHKYVEGRPNLAYIYLLILAYGLAFLMVSNIRYKSFKEINLASKKSFQWLPILIILIIIIASRPELILFLLTLAYVLSGIIGYLISYFKKKQLEKFPEIAQS